MALYQLDDQTPDVADSAWVADNAQVMGAVTIAADASVWFGVTVRGDTETIEIGEGSNIQDGSVMHADHGKLLGCQLLPTAPTYCCDYASAAGGGKSSSHP